MGCAATGAPFWGLTWVPGRMLIEKPSFFPMFLQSGTLLLAPMVNVDQIPVARIKLVVMPLKVHGVCAFPSRVIGIVPTKG